MKKYTNITIITVIIFVLVSFFSVDYLYSASKSPSDSPYGVQLEAPRVETGPEIDGVMDEAIWKEAVPFTGFKMVKPETGKEPSEKTDLRVIYDNHNLYIGVYCFDRDASAISVTSLAKDQRGGHGGTGGGSDLVRILLDPFQDKRNAYVFIVNAKGARTDGFARGERVSTNWDGIWHARAQIHDDGWCAEIRIPFKTISFNPRLSEWGFNVERYIPRRMEVIRLHGIHKNSFFYNPAEAALLTGINRIKQGKGITFKPYAALDVSKSEENGNERKWKINGGFDLYKNFTPNLVGVFTFQTDFAETELDDRRINLTRFSLYFPEKRAFFLEGSEIFNFEGGGGGWRPSFVPFFSRRIGIDEDSEEQVPIRWGAKVYGKIGNTNLALLNVSTKPVDDLNLPGQNFFAGRIYQNIFSQSKIGVIFTSGEPGSEKTNTLLGFDFLYSTARFMGDKNFSVSGWWATNKNQLEDGKKYGYGFKADYPNDLIDMAFTYNYFGDSLDPGLGFLPRSGVQQMNANFQFRPRPQKGWLGKMMRQVFFRIFAFYYWDMEGNIESYRISTAPFTMFRTESGETAEMYIIKQREVLDEPFEVSDGVIIPVGNYEFTRYQCQLRTASHRMISGQVEYETGDFYSGKLSKLELELNLNIEGNIRLGLESEFVNGKLPQGNFKEILYQAKADFYLNPDLGFMTYLQYDSVSENIGANIRFKWRISPGNTIYLVYNKNWERRFDPAHQYRRFLSLEDRGIIKLQFSWRP